MSKRAVLLGCQAVVAGCRAGGATSQEEGKEAAPTPDGTAARVDASRLALAQPIAVDAPARQSAGRGWPSAIDLDLAASGAVAGGRLRAVLHPRGHRRAQHRHACSGASRASLRSAGSTEGLPLRHHTHEGRCP
jgi:hypothetical protein